jgi:hypothetical protein
LNGAVENLRSAKESLESKIALMEVQHADNGVPHTDAMEKPKLHLLLKGGDIFSSHDTKWKAMTGVAIHARV